MQSTFKAKNYNLINGKLLKCPWHNMNYQQYLISNVLDEIKKK